MARLAASSKLQDRYVDALPASRALYERARRLFPDAVTHDNRRMQPFPLYVARADGAYKWDVDGNRYVDYWMGHGALLLGHNPRQVADAVRERLAKGDVAAVIIEPTGGHFGSVPAPASFVAALREETRRANVLLIFDEVVTGFRVAPGGAQAMLGIRPDLTTMAKILCGGLPGGACAGREDVMSYLATKPSAEENRRAKIAHAGTFNANPLSAAAGVAMLAAVADGQAIRCANQQAAKLRHGMHEILARENVAWKIYGEHSDWKIFFGAEAPPRDGSDQSVQDVEWRRLDAKNAEQSRALRQALILNGVDFNGARALGGTCHTDEVLGETFAAFEAAIRAMKEEGLA